MSGARAPGKLRRDEVPDSSGYATEPAKTPTRCRDRPHPRRAVCSGSCRRRLSQCQSTPPPAHCGPSCVERPIQGPLLGSAGGQELDVGPRRRPGACELHLDDEQIPSYTGGMRRKEGAILPIEESILTAALALRRAGKSEFHGFAIAKELQDRAGARRLTSHGTLYKALTRMEAAGLLTSRWEDPSEAAEADRPRRRLYKVTGAGEAAVGASDPSVATREQLTTRLAES